MFYIILYELKFYNMYLLTVVIKATKLHCVNKRMFAEHT